MKTRHHNTGQAGFTLVELMVVIAIIGILAGIAIPRLKTYREAAIVASAVSTGHQILNSYAAHAANSPGNRYPELFTTPEELVEFVGEHGALLKREHLLPFQAADSNAIAFVSYCNRCKPDGGWPPNIECEIVIPCPDDFLFSGVTSFSTLLRVESIERPEGEGLVMEVSPDIGVSLFSEDAVPAGRFDIQAAFTTLGF